MSSIQVHDKIFVPYLSQQQIQQRIGELAQQLNHDLQAERPLFLAVLNGAFMFAADLFRQLTIEAEISFIKLVSYKGTRSTGHVITSIGLDEDLYNRTVVILEDIVDTGKTLHEFLPQIRHQHPRRLLITALLSKPDARQYPCGYRLSGFFRAQSFFAGLWTRLRWPGT